MGRDVSGNGSRASICLPATATFRCWWVSLRRLSCFDGSSWRNHALNVAAPRWEQVAGSTWRRGVATLHFAQGKATAASRVRHGENKRDYKLFIGAVPLDATEDDLWHHFELMCGNVSDVRLYQGRGFGFVFFFDQSSASQALMSKH